MWRPLVQTSGVRIRGGNFTQPFLRSTRLPALTSNNTIVSFHCRQSFATSSSSSSSSSLKKLIQPFILKCHPDMAAQQGLPQTAVQVNLKAIQNLNSYIDAVIQLEKSQTYTFSQANDNQLVEIEFVMAFTSSPETPVSGSGGAAQPTTSRRRVELQVPPPQLPLPRASKHVQRQVIKLLRMADLPVPKLEPSDDEEYNEELEETNGGTPFELDEEWMSGQVVVEQNRRGKTTWDRSRERFLRRINWSKFDKVYQRALRDAQASVETRGLIRNKPHLRKQLLARILSHIHFTDSVTPLERLVAYRRLSRLLDDHFDHLQLESFGKYWEELQLVVTESRPYNTSSSAMRKRRQRHMETGYRFTIHHDNSVTVQIPIDFRNDELIQELRRNVSDFHEWTQHDDELGLEGILDDEEGIVI